MRQEADPIFSNIKGAKRIGLAYLKKYPYKSNTEVLLADLGIGLDQFKQIVEGKHNTWARHWLKEKQNSNFNNSKMVRLDGWWLSITEVQLCALITLNM